MTSNHPASPSPPRRMILALMALILAGLCLWGFSHSQLIPGMPFKDADDVLRMLQVLAWHDGGGWHDLTQYRLNPPAGLPMHWSRWPDLPLRGVLAIAEPWLGREQAILVTVTLVPVILGLGYFLAFVWAAEPLTGRAGSLQAGLIALAVGIPLIFFKAGRIDHHGWQLLLAIVMAGALLRLAAGDRRPWPPFLAGACGALGLWIGAEAIPVLAFTAIALIMVWWREGRWAADRLAIFGLATLAVTLLILPLALAPGQRDATFCDAFSLVSVALAAALALFGIGAAGVERLLGHLTGRGRMLASLLLGLPLLALLVLLFPHCLAGPYGELDPVAARLVTVTQESIPLGRFLADKAPTATLFILLPFLGLLFVIWRLWRSPPEARTLWLGLFTLVAGGFILPWWQVRGAFLANAYAGLALTWLAASLGARADQTRSLLARLAWRAGPAVLIAGLPPIAAVLVKTGLALPDAPSKAACDLAPALAVLNQSPYREQAPVLIAAHPNHGVAILWGTPHAVLAAPYHRDVEGLRDNSAILDQDEATAREAIARRGVAFLLLCPGEASSITVRAEGARQFQDLLLAGEIPAWLERVELAGDVRLLRVLPQTKEESLDAALGAPPVTLDVGK